MLWRLVALGHIAHSPSPPCQSQARVLLSTEITPLYFHMRRSAEPAALACLSPENAIIDLFRRSG